MEKNYTSDASVALDNHIGKSINGGLLLLIEINFRGVKSNFKLHGIKTKQSQTLEEYLEIFFFFLVCCE